LGFLNSGGWSLSDDVTFGVGGTFSNSPTVTCSPVNGAEFARMFLAPLQPEDLFGLLLADIPPEFVLSLGLHSIGPLRNGPTADGASDPARPPSGRPWSSSPSCRGATWSPSVSSGKGHSATPTSTSSPTPAGRPADPSERRLRQLPALPSEPDAFRLVHRPGAVGRNEIGIRTRALIEVLSQLAAGVDVPEDDVADGRAYDAAGARQTGSGSLRVAVRHSSLQPRDAFVAVPYDRRWFWIDPRDLDSKRVFTFVMLLTSLAQSSKPDQAPVITIPAG
jgi:hypothetical protein